MSSQFALLDVFIDNNDGTTSPVPGETVRVYDVTNNIELDPLVTDAFGVVPSGTLDVDPGTVIRFAVIRVDGRYRSAEQRTF